ncbi:MAG: hypothetical protein KAQ78_07850 [Candidatus Latescibacteria bacterium]|nr:hypothetical protein [Candidatus Latescibacterota bacterium]
MKVFCWPQGKLLRIEWCFECPKQDRCRNYQAICGREATQVERLRRAWEAAPPVVTITIRRKRTMAKSTNEGATEKKPAKGKQQYYYTYQYEGKEALQEIGDEDRILSIVTEGGKILKIYKLGDEQEVVIKIQKRTPAKE